MIFRTVVIITIPIYDPHSQSYTKKIKSEFFDTLSEALHYIQTLDYPANKITIHILSH